MSLRFKLEIDHSNNPSLIARLMYYLSLHRNFLDDQKNTTFILDDTIKISEKSVLVIFPKEDILLKYQNNDICISYKKTRESLLCHTTEIRFDQIIVSSNIGLTHISDFLYMIDKDYTIPDSTDTELIKYIWDGDNWKYNKTFNRRRLDTIYFHKKNYVSQELDKFLNNETTRKFYEKLDIPYKKIFLFYGIPGTGKSSFIRALASEYKYKLCIVKNIKNMDDSGLEDMINSIRQKSFLVFEDIDSMFIKRDAQTRGNFITFSGILNILDGISTYSKLVVFITTNFINQIDSAIKRRVDVAVEFTYLRKAEILEMIKQFFPDNDIGEQIYEQLKFKNITANALEKFFIHCIQKNEDVLKNIQFLDDYIYFSSNEQPPDSMYS